MIKPKLTIMLAALLLFWGCNQSNSNKQVKVQNSTSDTDKQQTEDTVNINYSDTTNSSITKNTTGKTVSSITITATARGQISHLPIVKDKALLNAKRLLADSLYHLLSVNDTTTQHIQSKRRVQITLRNMSIIKEGVKHYNKHNKSKIEAYVTVSINIPDNNEKLN